MADNATIKILGIDFTDHRVEEVVNILKQGGLLVVPAAPALINIKKDPVYYKALQAADIAIPDSSYMAMLWNIFHSKKIKKISGLKFLKHFLNDAEIKNSSELLLVDPCKTDAQHNIQYLKSLGLKVTSENSYQAPVYKKHCIEDEALLSIIKIKKPKFIIINLGGGVQEKLGAYIKANAQYKPAIICTGAAIAFLTGRQASIPTWGDKFFLGWLFRCIQNPKLYVPRYFKAFQLATLMVRHKQHKPV